MYGTAGLLGDRQLLLEKDVSSWIILVLFGVSTEELIS